MTDRVRKPKPPAGLVFAACAAAGAAALPAIYLFVRTLDASWNEIRETLLDDRTWILLGNTVALTAAVTVSASMIGIPAAWLTVRTDLPARRAWSAILALPLVLPSYLGGYAFVAALGPKGMVQNWLEPLGVERLPAIYGFGGAWLVLSIYTYPYVYLSVRGAFLRIDPALEEAAATLGQKPSRILWTVLLPQIWPAIATGALLVALYTLHDFGAVSLLRFDSLSRAIILSYEASFDRTGAALFSLVLVAMTLIVVAGEIRLRPGSSLSRVHSGGGRSARPVALNKYRWGAFGALFCLASLALILPATVIGYWLWQGLEAQTTVKLTLSAARNSLSASAWGTVLALAAAWPLAALATRFSGGLSRVLEKASFVAYALPGVVVALSLVFFGIKVVPWLYQTRLMLGFAYLVLFLPLATGALKTSFAQLSPRLDEAARVLGASRWRRLREIALPSVRPGLVAASSLVFLSAMKELPATLLLSPVDFSSLATRIWSATHAASFAAAAPPALLLVLLSSVPLALLMLTDEERAAVGPLLGENSSGAAGTPKTIGSTER